MVFNYITVYIFNNLLLDLHFHVLLTAILVIIVQKRLLQRNIVNFGFCNMRDMQIFALTCQFGLDINNAKKHNNLKRTVLPQIICKRLAF